MNQEDYDLPSEPQINMIVEQNPFQQTIYQLLNKKNWVEQDIQIIGQLFLQPKPSNIFNTKLLGLLLERYCLTLQFETKFFTSILANMQEKFFQENDLITEIHISYLKCCIETFNYKLGYKFIKKRIVMPHNKQDKNILCEYFFYSGVIYQSQRQYEDALNYYQITSKLPVNSIIKKQASKLELLLQFRLGRELKGQNDNELSQLFQKLQSIKQGDYNQINEDWMKKDEDLQLCLSECLQQCKLLGILQKEREIHLKVPLIALVSNEISKDQLIQYLIEINNIEDMLLINEEKDYIEFKNNNLNFTQINKSLENKLDLLQKMLN